MLKTYLEMTSKNFLSDKSVSDVNEKRRRSFKHIGTTKIHLPVFSPLLALAAIMVVCIALFTISFQSIKVAIANPVKSLRTE